MKFALDVQLDPHRRRLVDLLSKEVVSSGSCGGYERQQLQRLQHPSVFIISSADEWHRIACRWKAAE